MEKSVASAIVSWLLFISICNHNQALGESVWREIPITPNSVTIKPVFLVPKDEVAPDVAQKTVLMRYLQIAQSRYREMLLGEDTFVLENETLTLPLKKTVKNYQASAENGAPEMTAEVLDYLQVSRFSCPYVFVFVVMNKGYDFPPGGGRPLNGGVNTGGGVVFLSSFALKNAKNFESTLQHELGHAFGLPHVDSYGRNMDSDPSIMSYNPKHHTIGFLPSPTPGILVSQDIAALAKNRKIFSKLRLEMRSSDITLGPMDIPGHPSAKLKVSTLSGEAYGSKVGNVLKRELLASAGPGITFDSSQMWHSASTQTGWVSMDLEFPAEVNLTKIRVHSQHSGLYHSALGARVFIKTGGEEFQLVVDQSLAAPDADINFSPTSAKLWRIEFKAGPSREVVLRGVKFYSGSDELIFAQ